METIARLAVLLSCAAAGGTLLVVLAGQRPTHPSSAREASMGTLRGTLPAALAGYALLAGGTALTGAGALDAGSLAWGLRVGGVTLLTTTAVLAGLVTARPGAPFPVTTGGLVILLWAGGALALVSWLLAVGGVLAALAFSVRVEPHR